jgi:hypothetical protein
MNQASVHKATMIVLTQAKTMIDLCPKPQCTGFVDKAKPLYIYATSLSA